MKTERETFKVTNAQRAGWFWPAAVLLVATTIGIAWVGFPLMTRNNEEAKPLPAAAAAPNPLNSRMSAVEEKLNAWPKDRAGIMDKIAQIEKTLGANIRRARSEATALVEGVKREMNQSLEAIQVRLTGVESTQREAHDQVAQLQEDLATAKRDLEAVREANTQLANHLNQVQQAQQSTQSQVAGLQSQMQEGQNRVDALSYQVDRRRVDFELIKDRTDEVTPGIHLTITGTDVAHQHVNGWVQIAGDGRFVWLKEAGAQSPIPFASRGEERAYQLVFTRIGNGTASGYLLVPTSPVNTAELR
jgi:predicted RNase H-like nuclease (RuvC/YqgF family)